MRNDKRAVGIHMLRNSPMTRGLALAVRGYTASMARQRFRIGHVP